MRLEKRILSIFSSLCMALIMMTGTALAAGTVPQTEVTENGITGPEASVVNDAAEPEPVMGNGE